MRRKGFSTKSFQHNLLSSFSLDLTHCVTDDSRRLLTLMIRSPDSLRFIPLMQAYTEGEDTDSITITLFQKHYCSKLVETYYSPLPSTPLSRTYANILQMYPRNLHQYIFGEYHHVKSLFGLSKEVPDASTMPEKRQKKISCASTQFAKWVEKFDSDASILSNRCRYNIGFGIPCRHMFSLFFMLPTHGLSRQIHLTDDPTSSLSCMLTGIWQPEIGRAS